MGYRILVEKDEFGRRYWHNHRDATRWKVIDGELILFHGDSPVIVKYECTEWIKVEKME